VKVSAKVDYALQAIIEIARATEKDSLISAEEVAIAHEIPEKFLEGILTALRKAKLINSYRGPSGGYELALSPEQITVADVIRAIDGPLAAVRGLAPEEISYTGSSKYVADIWIATRVALRDVLENITIKDALSGEFQKGISAMLSKKDARKRRKSL
jgi:Rrf2 family protein